MQLYCSVMECLFGLATRLTTLKWYIQHIKVVYKLAYSVDRVLKIHLEYAEVGNICTTKTFEIEDQWH